ncbi:Sjogren's syndrome/scleroderma autoantigen 1 family protein [Saliphagus sp. GCM10025317]
MSDFDKEAEREKLRKKYERDEADREATQRMSDLLLKGATMTNTHCDVCGDPLFRYQGTTFCPSCHGGPEGVEASVDDGAGDEDPATAGGSSRGTRVDEHPSSESEAPAEETEAANDPEHAASSVGAADADVDRLAATPETRATSSTVNEGPGSGTPRETSDTSGPADAPDTPDTPGTSRAPSAVPSSGSSSGSSVNVGSDLEAGTDALVTALERFSRAAAEADDPRYAKACLEAAHEAAATLVTLRE